MANNINIVLNSSQYDKQRSVFSYKLPIPQNFSNKKVGLVYCSLYKQFFNITAANDNNKFTITWVDGLVYNFVFPDGNYAISDINASITYVMIQNHLYCISSAQSIQAVTFIQLLVNATQYGSQINFYQVPTAVQATALSYSIPTGGTWVLPTVAKCPSISFNASVGKLFGFSAGTYGAGFSSFTANSSITPEISVINNLLIRTNLINSQFTNPSDVMTAMDLNGTFGSLLVKSAGQILYSDITFNNFSEILVYFSDQNYNTLQIRDTEVCIILSIIDV